jgi:hypothetical protein
MGRPRKRQFVETLEEPHINNELDLIQEPAVAFPSAYSNFDAAFAQPYYNTSAPPADTESTIGLRSSVQEDGRVIWHFGDKGIIGGGSLNFGYIDFSITEDAPPSIDTVPQLSTGSIPSSSENGNSPAEAAIAIPPCSCLASMYLALASLQQLPSDIATALATVRSAATTASKSIWCPSCGSVILHKTTPPVDAFQNLMLLGTILPIIANCYGRLLDMIDVETRRADAAGEMKPFNFTAYGGLPQSPELTSKSQPCSQQADFLNGLEMAPSQWRAAVRALLRVDIYGHKADDITLKGLKDLVSEMEYRQRTRHTLMDAHMAAGTLEHNKSGIVFMSPGGNCGGETTRGCLEILKIAKFAIDKLVIA